MVTKVIVLGFIGAAVALADTVTTSDHVSLNGSLLKMSDGVIELEVSSRAGKELRWIPMSKVAIIEFNSIVFNPGGPPRVFGNKPPAESAQLPEPAVPGETIELRGRQYKPCRLKSIDDAKVHCGSKGDTMDYPRQTVMRIQVGGN